MKSEFVNSIEENKFKMVAFPPAGELLLTPEIESLWPNEIRQNPELQKSAKERIALLKSMTSIFDSLPIDKSIQEALESNTINENEVIELYDGISNMLENDPQAGRFILYMPFEILPNKEWNSASEELNNSKNRLIEAYMKVWKNLLSNEDVRANFIDGDFTDAEMDTKKVPRVVKAAHLVSKLIERNLINFQEAVTLIQDNSGTELARSMIEGLSVAEGLGLLAPFEEKALDQLKKEVVSENKSEEIEVSESRQAWLDIERKRVELEQISDGLVENILSGNLSQEDFKNKYFLVENEESSMVGIATLRKVIEHFSSGDIQVSKNIFNYFESDLLRLWNSDNSKIEDALLTTWSYLKNLNVVDEKYLDSHNVKLPSLGGDVIDRRNELQEDIVILRLCMDQIESDAELSELLYSASVFYGSRVKGYGLNDSDYDIAIFIRPGTDFDKRFTIREKLSQIFKEKKLNVKPIEFWLDKNMSVKNFDIDDDHVANSFVVDPLFSGIMLGNNETIKAFYEKLLPQYLYEQNTNESLDERTVRLQDLERNNLQYRLMHRGYRHFFPKQGKDIKVSAIKSIDGESAFWDSGYRRLSSKIFVKKVFLPQITDKK